MLTRQTVVDQIEVTRSGVVQIRLALEIVEDGKVITSKWHRTAIELGGDAMAQMLAVNDHLVSMGECAVDILNIDRIKAHTDLATRV